MSKPQSSDSDKTLVAAANRGDTTAFDTLYYRYRDWVFGLAWRFTANQADALDVLQETFTYLFKKFPGFTLTATMKTFLYPVVKHVSLRCKEKTCRFAGNDPALDQIADQPQSTDQGRQELADALKPLPDDQRELLLLRFADDMSLKEIAVALKLSLGTVKSRLYRALQTLRDHPATRKYFLD